MKKMKQFKALALLFSLLVGLFANLLAPVVKADDSTVNITLHKVKDYTGGTIINTGEPLTGTFTYLPGITFDVYDVTQEYYNAYDASIVTKTVTDAIADAVNAVKGTAGEAPSGKSSLQNKTTAADGSAVFGLVAKSGGRNAVYLFVERESAGVKTVADNLVVALPIYKAGTNDVVLSDIHLYPKNITKEIPFEKEITSQKGGAKQTDFSIGQTIDYKLTTTIPADIAATQEVSGSAVPRYNIFKFVDTFKTDQLTFINNSANYSVKVTDGPVLTPVEDYTVTVEDASGTTTVTTKLTVAGIVKLATHANKSIAFDYQMKINSLTYIDTGIVNTAQAIFGNDGTTGLDEWEDETPTDTEEVKTGGFKFVKVDVNNNAKKLAGAKFVVRNGNTADAKYFKATADGAQWVDTVGEASEYETGSDGIVDVRGLEYGTYYLQEIVAPAGYALPTGDAALTEFEVTQDSHTTTNSSLYHVVNTPKGFLPSTGGTGIVLFLALGVGMIALAGTYFTARRKN